MILSVIACIISLCLCLCLCRSVADLNKLGSIPVPETEIEIDKASRDIHFRMVDGDDGPSVVQCQYGRVDIDSRTSPY